MPSSVTAGAHSYDCEVLSERKLGDDGMLTEGYGIYGGRSFSVERKSGVVLGGGLGNSSYEKPDVLSRWSKEMPFTAVCASSPVLADRGGRNVVMLTIKEYFEGVKKTFCIGGGRQYPHWTL